MSIRMPPRGDETAPTFDPAKPRELRRFFSELEYLFSAANVTDNSEKKKHTLRYVTDFDVADLWESLPEFPDASKSYNDFRMSIFELYPTADDDYKYTLADMDSLIANRLSDLADYHAQFLAITTFLISKQRLSEIEQQRAYISGFPALIWTKISQRLQLKLLDHLPDDPYDITDVYSAARFVLHSTRSSSLSAPNSIASNSPAPSTLDSVVKPEQLDSIFAEITKSIVAAINSSQLSPAPRTSSSFKDSTPRKVDCTFCGKDHYIRNCDLVEEYRRAGKLKHNIDGKIILPTGAYLPRDTPGRFLKDHIDEWHHRNPGQLATASLSYSTMLNSASAASTAPAVQVQLHANSQASIDARIAEIQAEIARLRAQGSNAAAKIDTHSQYTPPPSISTHEPLVTPRASPSLGQHFVDPACNMPEHCIALSVAETPTPRPTYNALESNIITEPSRTFTKYINVTHTPPAIVTVSNSPPITQHSSAAAVGQAPVVDKRRVSNTEVISCPLSIFPSPTSSPRPSASTNHLISNSSSTPPRPASLEPQNSSKFVSVFDFSSGSLHASSVEHTARTEPPISEIDPCFRTDTPQSLSPSIVPPLSTSNVSQCLAQIKDRPSAFIASPRDLRPPRASEKNTFACPLLIPTSSPSLSVASTPSASNSYPPSLLSPHVASQEHSLHGSLPKSSSTTHILPRRYHTLIPFQNHCVIRPSRIRHSRVPRAPSFEDRHTFVHPLLKYTSRRLDSADMLSHFNPTSSELPFK